VLFKLTVEAICSPVRQAQCGGSPTVKG
jgi:hypothetical protein